MKFFVSWTSREAPYQDYDPDAKVLVSPHCVPKSWTISDWQNLPKELLVDSGAYSYAGKGLQRCDDILRGQLAITKKWPKSRKLFFAHPDVIIPQKSTFLQTQTTIDLSLTRAREYFELLKRCKHSAIPIGVIHGFDEESILGSFYELREIGYTHFALGSLASRFARHRDKCLDVISLAVRYEIHPLHIFGISIPLQNHPQMNRSSSFDSSTPAKLGFYGTVLYGTPLKRYVLAPNAEQKMRDKFFKFRDSLNAPLSCNCPICIDAPERLLAKRGIQAKTDKAIHNYFQLKWATESIH